MRPASLSGRINEQSAVEKIWDVACRNLVNTRSPGYNNDRRQAIVVLDSAIQQHPGFCAGTELEFRGYRVDFETEHQLTRGPLQIDLLIIKKVTDEIIDNEIENLFRRYNIVEYLGYTPGQAMALLGISEAGCPKYSEIFAGLPQ